MPPRLDLPTLLGTNVFDEEDLAHNRRGVLSPAQEAWRKAHPTFVDDDDEDDGAIETIVGRVAIEGAHVAGRMGETLFASLVVPGRRFALRPGIERGLARGAPYRAHAARGWIWSIEPITEEELRAATAGAVTYRSAYELTGDARIARALQQALSIELTFGDDDVRANQSGRFSSAQRAAGWRKLIASVVRLVVSVAAFGGFIAFLSSGAPVFLGGAFLGVIGLFVFALMSAWLLVDALGRLIPRAPLCVLSRLDNDPANRDRVLLENDGSPKRIKRAAIAIAEAPFSEVRAWRFEMYVVPWTRSILSVRPVAPRRLDEERES